MANDGENDEEIISLQEVLEQQKYLEEAVQCVLGAAEDDKCSYSMGYLKRQPLYACLTCNREAGQIRAGICLGCSLHCHEGHECVELYTKRNFRCDCGNNKFPKTFKCLLQPNKDAFNGRNVYNQNFDGVYCVCHRPYPESDENSDLNDEPMLQCIVCEDWFHPSHVEMDEEIECEEFVCKLCANEFPFLHNYSVKDTCPSNDEISKTIPETNEQIKGCLKLRSENVDDSPCYLALKWRETLCTCSECKSFYKDKNIEYLLDLEDTIEAYEKKAKAEHMERCLSNSPSSSQGSSTTDPCMKAIEKLDRVQQIELIQGYNDFSSELGHFLEKFASENKVVKEKDVHEFFDHLREKKRRRLNDQFDPL